MQMQTIDQYGSSLPAPSMELVPRGTSLVQTPEFRQPDLRKSLSITGASKLGPHMHTRSPEHACSMTMP